MTTNSLTEFFASVELRDFDLAMDVVQCGLRALFDTASSEYSSLSRGQRILMIARLDEAGWSPAQLLGPFIADMLARGYSETEAVAVWAETMSGLVHYFIRKLGPIDKLAMLAEEE